MRNACYLNGSWVGRDALKLDVDDMAITLGAAASERLRTFHGEAFRTEAHLDRLSNSLQILGIPPHDLIELCRTIVPELVHRNWQSISSDADLSISLFISPGLQSTPNDSERQATICGYASPLPFHTWAKKYKTGERLMVSTIRQIPAESWPRELKCRSRVHYYLADREAAIKRKGSRAILLDNNGYVCEASTANLILAKDGILISPPMKDVLPGVSLAVVQELAEKLGIPFEFHRFRAEELFTAEEVLLASTSACLIPVSEIDGKSIGSPGPIFQKLMNAWNDLVGLDIFSQAEAFANNPSSNV